jgi:lipid A 3-O-deacylase
MGNRLVSAALAGAGFLAPFVSHAQADPAAQSEGGTFSVLFENDIFYHTDRDYTNGVQLAWTTPPSETWDWATTTARWLPFFAQEGDVRTSYSLGQNIYTPSNLTLSNPDPTDRPYAGFLYLGLGVTDETPTQLDQMQLEVGMVGPDSLAQESQTFVHRIINDEIPQGWSYQLRNEPAFVLIDEKTWRTFESGKILGFSFDVDPHVGAAVGTVYDYANAGAMARFGFDLPDDYGPTRIDPSLPGTNFFEPTGPIGGYLFAGVDGRAIARNIFLDGNTWSSSRSVDKVPLVGDLQLGAALTFPSFRLSFTHVFRTKEFTTQHHADQFGAINLSVRT